MGQRRLPRTKMVLPVRVWGMDCNGQSFNSLAYTLDLSSSGARLCGVRVPLAVGDAITVQYKQQKALFKIAWVGRPGSKTGEQFGIQLLEPDKQIWIDLPKGGEFVDDFDGSRRQSPPQSPPPPPAETVPPLVPQPVGEPAPPPLAPSSPDMASEDLNSSLRACTMELAQIERMVKDNTADPAALHDFRAAVAKARQTAWAIQQWQYLNREGSQPFPLLWYLNSERLRFMVQAAQDLWNDFSKKGVELDETLIGPLFEIFEKLKAASTGTQRPTPDDWVAEVEEPLGPGPVARIVAARRQISRYQMDVDSALNLLAFELLNAANATGVAVALRQQDRMAWTACIGTVPDLGTPLETQSGLVGQAIASGHLLSICGPQVDESVRAELRGDGSVQSILLMPVFWNESLQAVIEVCSDSPDPFAGESLEAIESTGELVRELLTRSALGQ